MHRILIIDDNLDFSFALKKTLSKIYDVVHATKISDAKSLIEKERFDLILLDLELPDGTGFDFCHFLKENDEFREIPVLIISGNSATDAKVQGLDLGADDYLEKPIEKSELCARIRARLRISEKSNSQIRGPFTIDFKNQKAFLSERGKRRDLKLTPSEFKILSCFIDNSGKVIARDELIQRCFGEGYNISNRAVDLHVFCLRKKIGQEHDYIKSVYGSGYLLKVS